MTVVSFFCLFISLVLSTPCCFGAEPNHENGWEMQENCTGDLNCPIYCFGSKPNPENGGNSEDENLKTYTRFDISDFAVL